MWWGYSGACGTNSGVMGSTGPSGLPLLQQLLAPQAVRSHGGGSCCGGGHEHGHHHDHGHDHAPDHLEDLPKDELADAETRTAWVPPSMGIAAQQAVAAAAAEAESSSTASSGPSDVSHLPKHMQEVGAPRHGAPGAHSSTLLMRGPQGHRAVGGAGLAQGPSALLWVP